MLGVAGGFHTYLAAPLRQQGELIGGLFARRIEIRPFTQAQIKLLETFANQAVIAIENVRLFQELKESLEQQTATSEILGVIASSPTDIQPVLDVVAENAARLCEATDAVIHRIDGDKIRVVANYGPLPGQYLGLLPIDRGSIPGRAIIDRRTLHIDDLAALPEDDLRARFAERSAFGRYWPRRCCVREFPSGRFISAAWRSARLPTSRSNFWKPLPTRP